MDPRIMEGIYKRIQAQQFELSAQLPVSWRRVSLNLKRAADKLYDCYHDATLRGIQRLLDEVESNQNINESRELRGAELEDFLDGQLISAYFLLIGCAFENLLKGILMLEHREYFKPDTKLKDIKDHNLVNLCGRCKIPLKAEEAKLLKKLTTYVEWQGRYPIPLESEKMPPIKQADGSWETSGEAFHGRETQQEIDNLYIKIWDELERRKSASGL